MKRMKLVEKVRLFPDSRDSKELQGERGFRTITPSRLWRDLSQKVPANVSAPSVCSPIRYGCGSEFIPRPLLEAQLRLCGQGVNAVDTHSWSALHYSAASGQLEAQVLLGPRGPIQSC